MDQPLTLLRPEQAAQRLGISRRSLFNMMKAGDFPRPVRLGSRTIRFVSSDIDTWIAERLAERDDRAA